MNVSSDHIHLIIVLDLMAVVLNLMVIITSSSTITTSLCFRGNGHFCGHFAASSQSRGPFAAPIWQQLSRRLTNIAHIFPTVHERHAQINCLFMLQRLLYLDARLASTAEHFQPPCAVWWVLHFQRQRRQRL